MTETIKTEVVVIGSGPGGYAAAFRAADLGKQVTLIERYDTLGGVCLNVGCIPSKALLHAAKLIDDADSSEILGISFSKPTVDVKKLLQWKEQVSQRLTKGLSALAKARAVNVIQGTAQFASDHSLIVKKNGKAGTDIVIEFEQAVIAAGSSPMKLPFASEDPRVMTSTGALELPQTSGHLLIIGGGIIGLEMATVYHALGMDISIVEMQSQIIPGADADLVKPLYTRIKKRYREIMLETQVTKIEPKKEGLFVNFKGEGVPKEPVKYDLILVAVGRTPNGKSLAVDKAGVSVDERGFIGVDHQMRTNVNHIYAIGDIVGQPMLAHKATREGHLVAEVIAGTKNKRDWRCIPSVAYTDPEVVWVGATENELKKDKTQYRSAVFPWAANGRAISLTRTEGMTKLLFDRNNTIIGAAIVGMNASDLISELALAIEMGCDAEDIALTIHPHPTLSETIGLAAERYEGTITDLMNDKKK